MLLRRDGRIIVQIDVIGIHLFGLLANHLIINIYPVSVQVNGHQGVTVVAASHIEGAHHQTVDAVGLIETPTVVVTTLVSNDRILLEYIDIGAIVVQIIKDGIMIHAQHPHAGFNHCCQCAVEPQEVFLLDVSVTHFHERSTVHTHHDQIIYCEDESVAAPQVIKRLAGTLAPVVLVVARDNVKRVDNTIQDAFDVAQLLIAALVGEISCEHHSIHIGKVDLGHRLTQFALIGITWCHMHITQDGQLHHSGLTCNSQQAQ